MTAFIPGLDDLRYPPIKPYNENRIALGDGHKMYYAEFGNPAGEPVLYVHGGPGQGLFPDRLRVFDPTFWRIIGFDQRGCGQSAPHFADNRSAALKGNNPDQLVQDIERLRLKLKIDKWHLCGGSWGATLALLYAVAYPAHVSSLLLSAIWLHRVSDIDWYVNQMGRFFPEAEQRILNLLPVDIPNRYDRLQFLTKTIVERPLKQALTIAEAQGEYESAAVFLSPQPPSASKRTAAEKLEEQRGLISIGAIECHFMRDHPLPEGWFSSSKSKQALGKIKGIRILQGRYDIVCPPRSAFDLKQVAPHAELSILPLAGHAMSELNMMTAYMQATEAIKLDCFKSRR